MSLYTVFGLVTARGNIVVNPDYSASIVEDKEWTRFCPQTDGPVYLPSILLNGGITMPSVCIYTVCPENSIALKFPDY